MEHFDEKQNFERLRNVRNAMTLRMWAILSIVFYMGFWAVDWYMLPQYVWLTFQLRLICSIHALGIFLAYRFRRHWVQNHVWPLTLSLALSMSWSLAAICWLHQGYESPYFNGLNMIVLIAAMSFSWTVRQSATYSILVFGFYIAPLLTGFLQINDFPIAFANQLFFITILIVSSIFREYRAKMEKRDFYQRRKLKEYLKQVRVLAARDPLTDLNNRRQLMLLGQHEFHRCDRYHRSFAAIIVDIDHFKSINDRFGHAVGDEVIRSVAKVLIGNSRSTDIVGRHGGEEFLIFLPEANSEQATTIVGERIQNVIRNFTLDTSAGKIGVRLSMGVCDNALDRDLGLQNLIDRADSALYEAKRRGRDCIIEWRENNEYPLKPQFAA